MPEALNPTWIAKFERLNPKALSGFMVKSVWRQVSSSQLATASASAAEVPTDAPTDGSNPDVSL